MTLSDLRPRFQGDNIFYIEYLRNNTRQSHCYYRTSIGSHMHSIAWWHFQWPWWTLTRFSRSQHFLKSNIGKMAHLKRQSYYCTKGKIPNIWNGTMFGDLNWLLIASRGFVSISWASCWYRVFLLLLLGCLANLIPHHTLSYTSPMTWIHWLLTSSWGVVWI